MTDQEKFNAELQLKTSLQEAKFNMLVNELKEQREDMRKLWEKQDADMKAMNERIDSTYRELIQQIHTNFVQTMIGVGAIMAAIGGLIIATLK